MTYREIHEHHFRTLAALSLPRPMRTIALLILCGVVLLSAFLVLAPWVQTAPGAGTVIALDPNDRQQDINALVSGRIAEWFVRDGSHVNVGDPIVRIIDIDPNLLERLGTERDQVLAKLTAARAAERTAAIDQQRTEELFEEGLAARRELEQARIKVQELRAKAAEAAAELSRVDVNLSRQSSQFVRAPRNGVILRVNAGDSATVIRAGDAVASFVPDNASRAVELFIDGRDVALMRTGARVRLQFEGWPAVQFSGWPSLAVGTFAGEVVSIDPSAQASGRFRVLVREAHDPFSPWPDTNYLRYGAKVRGWVMLEEVRVGYELWRQLNNFPPEFPASGG
ncbi:MAG: HlyD family efflux transporter periplasmic adaptor subunit [Pseudomonadales bacterium]